MLPTLHLTTATPPCRLHIHTAHRYTRVTVTNVIYTARYDFRSYTARICCDFDFVPICVYTLDFTIVALRWIRSRSLRWLPPRYTHLSPPTGLPDSTPPTTYTTARTPAHTTIHTYSRFPAPHHRTLPLTTVRSHYSRYYRRHTPHVPGSTTLHYYPVTDYHHATTCRSTPHRFWTLLCLLALLDSSHLLGWLILVPHACCGYRLLRIPLLPHHHTTSFLRGLRYLPRTWTPLPTLLPFPTTGLRTHLLRRVGLPHTLPRFTRWVTYTHAHRTAPSTPGLRASPTTSFCHLHLRWIPLALPPRFVATTLFYVRYAGPLHGSSRLHVDFTFYCYARFATLQFSILPPFTLLPHYTVLILTLPTTYTPVDVAPMTL